MGRDMSKPRNARFWFGDIKITLQPGQRLRWEHFSPTEEGWQSVEETFDYDYPSGLVTHERHEAGSDCDGRYEYHSIRSCHIFHLRDLWNEYTLNYQPAWERVHSWQRDYTAEAMGY